MDYNSRKYTEAKTTAEKILFTKKGRCYENASNSDVYLGNDSFAPGINYWYQIKSYRMNADNNVTDLNLVNSARAWIRASEGIGCPSVFVILRENGMTSFIYGTGKDVGPQCFTANISECDVERTTLIGSSYNKNGFFTGTINADNLSDAVLSLKIENYYEPFAAIIGNLFTREKYNSSDEALEMIKDLNGKNFLVFDYGGGTLDITVAQCDNGRFLELGTSELTGSAGDRFDELIAKYVWHKFMDKYSSKYSEDYLEKKRKDKWHRIIAIAERCKIELSTKESTDFLLNNVTGINEDIRETITRSTFEVIISGILESTSNKIEEALHGAKKEAEDIDMVLLTGGTCNIPLIQQRLIDKFGSRVETARNSDLVIAQGAAVIAEMGWLPFLTKDIRIVLSDGSYWALFEKYQPIASENKPARNEEVFTCMDQRQKRAKIIVDEGYGQEAGKTLCTINVPTLGDGRFGDDVYVSGELDKDIILTISAYSKMATDYDSDATTRRSAEIYQMCFGLDLSERK